MVWLSILEVQGREFDSDSCTIFATFFGPVREEAQKAQEEKDY
jgi:hypothetical protein